MNWSAFAGNIIKRVPIEKLIFPPKDNLKSLLDLYANLEGPKGSKEAPPAQIPMDDIGAASDPLEKLSFGRPEVHLSAVHTSQVSAQETIDYQNREIGKELLRMQRHYAQRLRINGIPCECGSQQHLLSIEALAEETVPMVDNPDVYYRVVSWVQEVGPKSTEEAAKSGLYDEEYPVFSHQARDLRKEIIGTLDPHALFPQKPGEKEGTRILPVVTDEEREQIKEQAHRKIEEVLNG